MSTLLSLRAPLAGASDEQLVDLVRAGDERAFSEIVDRYEARLTAFARRLLGGAHHDAEEVVQDAFWRALRAVHAEDLEALVAGLRRLPARQRTALVLHEMGDESHRTIARRLDVSVGGSKALVSRARAGLAQARRAA